ncbi:hypothetical protein ACFW9F_29660, partial [Streptomyces sp. NPDC059506]
MSRQGDRNHGDENRWWAELYSDDAPDTGPPPRRGDTVDDRFGSVTEVLGAAAAEDEGTRTEDGADGPDGPGPPPWWTPPPPPPPPRPVDRH